jgi:endoglycosylceramidase
MSRRHRCLLLALTTVLLSGGVWVQPTGVVLPVAATDAVEPAPPLAPLGHAGRWITDAGGRVVILHGFNIVNKSSHNLAPSTIPFGDRDAVFLHSEGFNAMRVGLIYSALESSPGTYDDTYINDVAGTIADLTSRGIFSLADFHQDDFGPVYAGEGFPTWASLDDGLSNQPQGFFQDYVANPAMNRAFDNFWDDRAGPGGVGLQERYASAVGHVAQTLAGQSGLIGYDIINEPWPADVVEAPGDVDSPAATDWQACANPAGCPTFDSGQLSAFYLKVLPAIHSGDPVHLAWYEPLLLFDFGANTSMVNFNDPKAGFSFHDYCLGAGAGGAFPPRRRWSVPAVPSRRTTWFTTRPFSERRAPATRCSTPSSAPATTSPQCNGWWMRPMPA